MGVIKILWADDEMDLLKAHQLFLEEKGYTVVPVSNGDAAIEKVREERFDLIFLDEHMPGLSGLETLTRLKQLEPDIPVVLITKSEEEEIMEDAIGASIADYLIKPVNPRQILLSIKKLMDSRDLVNKKTAQEYQKGFRELDHVVSEARTFEDWVEIYKQLTFWDLELARGGETGMDEVLDMQRREAQRGFAKFVSQEYPKWIKSPGQAPLMIHRVLREKVIPELSKDRPTVVILIDNLRYDQFRVMAQALQRYLIPRSEEMVCSLLPATTQYARNGFFSGLLPQEMARRHPDWWVYDDENEGKNLYEKEFLEAQLKQLRPGTSFVYEKILNRQQGEEIVKKAHSFLDKELSVLVYNFVDMLSHARSEMQMVKELASDEKAYRGLTLNWFEHSELRALLQTLSGKKARVVLCTDHGTVRVREAVKVLADRNSSNNLRYKHGRNLNVPDGGGWMVREPEELGLPKPNVSSSYLIARDAEYFIYPNDFARFARQFKDSFQHGGISLEELLIPLAIYSTKSGA